MKRNSFPKAEHLCGEKRIARLFSEGDAFIVYPLRVVFSVLPEEDNCPVKVMVNVPKKRFKRAVKRNRLKRLMREAYRQNKHTLVEVVQKKNMQMHVAFNYVSDEELEFDFVEKRMRKTLERLKEKVDAL